MRDTSRSKKEKQNIIISFFSQILLIPCGLISSHTLLNTFGSELYGTMTSITQFLSYIMIVEGGINVLRAALYRPLAEHDTVRVAKILKAIKRFFFAVGMVFSIYVLILAFSFQKIGNVVALDYWETFLLVLIISVSTFAQYFIGMSYYSLLYADQKAYLLNAVSMLGSLGNAVLIVILAALGANIHVVKLLSAVVFASKPVFAWFYVKKVYKLPPVSLDRADKDLLKDKWTGIGQHIAFFVHNNTDIVLLTLMVDLKTVAVYSVYFMVLSSIQALASSVVAGSEALFGELYAMDEKDALSRAFAKYETLVSVVGIILYAATAILILPFVSLYTAGLEDAEYYRPLFSLLLTLAGFLYMLRLPSHNIVIAAGHFKETRLAAYGEAGLNVGLSILLVGKFGLVGVAIGTMVATAFRYLFYVFYLSRRILMRPVWRFLKRISVNGLLFGGLVWGGNRLLSLLEISSYSQWLLAAVPVCVAAAGVTCFVYALLYRDEWKDLLSTLLVKRG